jgi:hypothetical protein
MTQLLPSHLVRAAFDGTTLIKITPFRIPFRFRENASAHKLFCKRFITLIRHTFGKDRNAFTASLNEVIFTLLPFFAS